MPICPNGHILTKTDIVAGQQRALKAFAAVVHQGDLPKSYKIISVPNYAGRAATDTRTTLFVDPYFVSCYDSNTIKTVILHEAGHYHNGSYLANPLAAYGLMANFILASAIATIPFLRASRNATRRLRKIKKPKRKNFIPLKFLIMAWTLNGAYFVNQVRKDELKADLFAATAMHDPKPMETILQTEQSFQSQGAMVDEKSQDINRNSFYFGVIGYFVIGPAAFFDDHPGDEARIRNLKNHRDQIVKGQPSSPSFLSL